MYIIANKMSDLRLEYSKTELSSIISILSDLFRVQNDKRYVIRGWGKKILNYGIKQEYFDKTDSHKQRIFHTTKRQFRNHRIKLMDLRFIDSYGKDERVKGGDYYSITPLGLLFLLKNNNEFSINSIIEMFEYLSSISLNSNFKVNKKSWQYFNNIEINKAMKILLEYLNFDYVNNKLIISLDVFLQKSLNKISLTQVIIDQRYIKVRKPSGFKKVTREYIKTKELDFGISFFIRNLLCYYLFMNTKKDKINKIPKDFRLFFVIISEYVRRESVNDFVESEKKRIQSYGEDDSRIISLITKQKLQSIMSDLV